MQSFVASYTDICIYIFLCFDAASSDFGLNLQIYVSSSGQILKRLYVCVDRENVIWSNRSFLCVKRGFWDHVCFFFSCLLLWCSEKMHWSLRLRIQTGVDSVRDFSGSCVFYNAFYDYLSLIFILYFCSTLQIYFFDFLKTIVKFTENSNLNCINKAELIRYLFVSLTVIDAVSLSVPDSASMMVRIDLEFTVSTLGPPPIFYCSCLLLNPRGLFAALQSDVSLVAIKKRKI